jgi:hypothetical protein
MKSFPRSAIGFFSRLRYSLAAVLVAAGVFTTSAAHAESKLMEACVRQFLSDALPGFQGAVKVQDDFASRPPLVIGINRYNISLSATEAQTGEQLAKGVCQVNRYGDVLSLKSSTVSAEKLAKLAQPGAMRIAVVASNKAGR